MVKNGDGHSRHGTLKLVISQELIDGINRFSACLYKFRKAKTYCKNLWVDVGCGLLDHGTLKSAVSQNEMMN